MSRQATLLRGILFLSLLAALPVLAWGPLYVGGPPQSAQFPDGIPNSVPGLPFRWVNDASHTPFPLTYWTDKGGLGTLQEPDADNLVATAFGVWQGVETADISFSKAGNLSQDVTASNALSVQNALYDCSTLPGAPSGGIAQPRSIIYDDSSGSIISKLGDDPNTTLGFADTPCLQSDGTSNYFTRGYAVLNGKFTDTQADLTDLKAVMIHEFGHMIGLDHSQINLDCLTNFSCAGLDGVPVMFPYLLEPAPTNLRTDDKAGISTLYPVTTSQPNKVLFNTLGAIQGHVYFSDGVTPAQGFNVIARAVSDPLITAVSSTSGYLFTPDAGNPLVPWPGYSPSPYGSTDQSLIGYYYIPGLPPGDYTVELEALNGTGSEAFVLSSGVGPIGTYEGFQFPLPSLLPTPPPCTPEYLVSNATASCTDKTTLTVNAVGAGQPLSTGTDIILIATPPRYDAWEGGP